VFDTILELSGFEVVLLWALFTTANGIAKAFSQGVRDAKNERSGNLASCEVCSFKVQSTHTNVVSELMDNHYEKFHPTFERKI
jgi:hypothetical protein